MTKRKYNAILWCDKTPNGYWSIGMESPEGTFQRKTYVGYSRSDAIRKAKQEGIDKKNFFNQSKPVR